MNTLGKRMTVKEQLEVMLEEHHHAVLCSDLAIRSFDGSLTPFFLTVGHSSESFRRWLDFFSGEFTAERFDAESRIDGYVWFVDGSWACTGTDRNGDEVFQLYKRPAIPAYLADEEATQ